MRLCYCRQGVMCRCTVANDRSEQQQCRFYEKSLDSTRCSHLRENIDDHCDSVYAQMSLEQDEQFEFDFDDLPELEEEEIDITELLEDTIEKMRGGDNGVV